MSFASLGSMLVTGGNFMFTACTAGSSNAVPEAVINIFLGKNYNYFFNIGLGGFTSENRNDSIRNNVYNKDGKILMYQNGNKSYISDLIININNQEPISIIK